MHRAYEVLRLLRFGAALLIVILVSEANATPIPETSRGVYTAAISVPEVGRDCPSANAQIMYDSISQSTSSQHQAAAPGATVTGAAVAHVRGKDKVISTFPNGSTSFTVTSTGASANGGVTFVL